MARKKQRQLKAAKAARVRKKNRGKRKKRALILVLEVMILSLLLGTVYVMAKYNKFQKVTIEEEDIEINEGAKKEGYTTVALFGGDSREGELEEGTHADTMIVASIEHETGTIRMASIYRDTLMQQADGSYLKANNAYFAGGPTEAINVLNKNLDLDIEDYVTVDFKALVDTIDLLGGLEIEVSQEEAEMLNEYLRETAEVAGTEVNWLGGAGVYNMDGAQAVTYARLRKLEGGDFKRTERQRIVIQKMFEKGIKTNLATINEIIDTVFPQVSTNFTLPELISLAADVTKYELGESTGFPMDKTDAMFGDAGSVVVAVGHVENVQQLHEILYPQETDYIVSGTVQFIADEIAYLTGIVRPENYEGTDDGMGGTYYDSVTSDTSTYTDPNYTGDTYTEDTSTGYRYEDTYTEDYYPEDNYTDDTYTDDTYTDDTYTGGY